MKKEKGGRNSMETETEKKRRGLSCNAWKIIACVSMLIDHIGAALIEGGVMHTAATYAQVTAVLPWPWHRIDTVLRLIGRLAFPIYCFFLVEGFFHTRDVKKYALRLGAFALISEVPFDRALLLSFYYPAYQNVYFTLLLGLIMMVCAQRVEAIWKKLLIAGAFMAAAELIHSDYGALGLMIIFLFYQLHIRTKGTGLSCLYSGERGRLRLKWFFYLFYPVHLLILAGVRYLWLGF